MERDHVEQRLQAVVAVRYLGGERGRAGDAHTRQRLARGARASSSCSRRPQKLPVAAAGGTTQVQRRRSGNRASRRRAARRSPSALRVARRSDRRRVGARAARPAIAVTRQPAARLVATRERQLELQLVEPVGAGTSAQAQRRRGQPERRRRSPPRRVGHQRRPVARPRLPGRRRARRARGRGRRPRSRSPRRTRCHGHPDGASPTRARREEAVEPAAPAGAEDAPASARCSGGLVPEHCSSGSLPTTTRRRAAPAVIGRCTTSAATTSRRRAKRAADELARRTASGGPMHRQPRRDRSTATQPRRDTRPSALKPRRAPRRLAGERRLKARIPPSSSRAKREPAEGTLPAVVAGPPTRRPPGGGHGSGRRRTAAGPRLAPRLAVEQLVASLKSPPSPARSIVRAWPCSASWKTGRAFSKFIESQRNGSRRRGTRDPCSGGS